jgi:hypothetical protein
MGCVVHLTQFLSADMGVNLGGGDAGVAQHFLHMPQVCAVVQHHGGCRMAKQMAGTEALYSRQSDVVNNNLKVIHSNN